MEVQHEAVVPGEVANTWTLGIIVEMKENSDKAGVLVNLGKDKPLWVEDTDIFVEVIIGDDLAYVIPVICNTAELRVQPPRHSDTKVQKMSKAQAMKTYYSSIQGAEEVHFLTATESGASQSEDTRETELLKKIAMLEKELEKKGKKLEFEAEVNGVEKDMAEEEDMYEDDVDEEEPDLMEMMKKLEKAKAAKLKKLGKGTGDGKPMRAQSGSSSSKDSMAPAPRTRAIQRFKLFSEVEETKEDKSSVLDKLLNEKMMNADKLALGELLQLSMLQQLQGNKKTNKKLSGIFEGKEDGDGEEEDDEQKGSSYGIGRHLGNYDLLRKEIETEAGQRKIISSFLKEIMEEAGVEADDVDSSVNIMKFHENLPWANVTLRRCFILMLSVLKLQLADQPLKATAQNCRNLRTLMQASLHDGKFTSAWRLSYLKDPLESRKFGGTERELQVIASMEKSLVELERIGMLNKGKGNGKPWWQQQQQNVQQQNGQPWWKKSQEEKPEVPKK